MGTDSTGTSNQDFHDGFAGGDLSTRDDRNLAGSFSEAGEREPDHGWRQSDWLRDHWPKLLQARVFSPAAISGPTSAKLIHGTTKMDDKKNEVVDYDGINLRIVHYCVENEIPYESSMPLERFKSADGSLDDVKLIKAFNDDKAPLIFTPKEPIAGPS